MKYKPVYQRAAPALRHWWFGEDDSLVLNWSVPKKAGFGKFRGRDD
jgi:hypothetical protein